MKPWRTHGKQSALHSFRDAYIATQKHAGVCRNWLSKDSWDLVKREFNSLSPEEQDGFKTAANMSNKNVNQKRKQQNQQSQVVRAEQVAGGTIDVQNHASAGPPPPSIVNAYLGSPNTQDLKHCMGSVGDYMYHLQDSFAKASQQSGVNPWPIAEDSILSSLLSLKSRKIRLQDAAQTLKKTCEVTAGPKSDQHKFPDKVLYGQHCRGVCCATGFYRVRMQSHIVRSLNNMACSRYAKPTELVQDDLLLSFTVSSDGVRRSQDFFLVTAVAFKGGVQKPTQSYVKLCSNSFSTDGILRLVPGDFVQTINVKPWPSPLNSASIGTVATLSTAQLAGFLIGSDDCTGLTVFIQKHLYTDVSRSSIRVTGIASDWDPITIDKDNFLDEKRSGSSSKQPPATPGFIGHSDHSSSIDMLDFFSSAETMEAKSAVASADRLNILDSLMDALNLVDEGERDHQNKSEWQEDFEGLLDPEQLDVLREADEFLKAQESDTLPDHLTIQSLKTEHLDLDFDSDSIYNLFFVFCLLSFFVGYYHCFSPCPSVCLMIM